MSVWMFGFLLSLLLMWVYLLTEVLQHSLPKKYWSAMIISAIGIIILFAKYV